jgi:hypothetical protein
MKRTTIFKTILMMALLAGAMTLSSPAQASQNLLSCTTECVGSSGVNHDCAATILGVTVHLDLGINRPVQACGPVGSMVFDPATQQVCGLTPDAVFGIVVPVQDQCGSYLVLADPILFDDVSYETVIK